MKHFFEDKIVKRILFFLCPCIFLLLMGNMVYQAKERIYGNKDAGKVPTYYADASNNYSAQEIADWELALGKKGKNLDDSGQNEMPKVEIVEDVVPSAGQEPKMASNPGVSESPKVLESPAVPESPEVMESQEASETAMVKAETVVLQKEEATNLKSSTAYLIKVNRALNVATVYRMDQDGNYSIPEKAMLVSTGKNNKTPLGTFHISDQYRWRKMKGGVYSQYASRIYRGILIHSVPYYTKNQANLEYHQFNKLGQQASAGCVRMSVEDAKWVYDHCASGTEVQVYDDKENPGPLGKPEAIQIDVNSANRGWDPTDPSEENPWRS